VEGGENKGGWSWWLEIGGNVVRRPTRQKPKPLDPVSPVAAATGGYIAGGVQGIFNIGNGMTDAGIEGATDLFYNTFLPKPLKDGLGNAGVLPKFPKPDWSNGIATHENSTLHISSKYIGAQSVYLLVGTIFGAAAGARTPPKLPAEIAVDAEVLAGPPKTLPPLIYRGGSPSPSNLKPRPGGLSFRDSLSNPVELGKPGPLGGKRPVFPPGEDYMAVDPSKLPEGSVFPDGVPGSFTHPPGHVTVRVPPATPATIKPGVIPKPLRPPYGPGGSGKFPS
jgi:hypothetical protein